VIGQKEVQKEEALRLHDIMRTGMVPISSGIAIDGGAHVGSWTVLMAEYFKLVYAFEPCAESYAMLLQNIEPCAELCQILPFQQALVAEVGKVDIVKSARRNKVRQTLTARQIRLNGTEVDGVTIDSLALPGCDFIKLDIEGAEPLALLGAEHTIRTYRPYLAVEFNCLSEQFGFTEEDLLAMLDRLGYNETWRTGVDRGYAAE